MTNATDFIEYEFPLQMHSGPLYSVSANQAFSKKASETSLPVYCDVNSVQANLTGYKSLALGITQENASFQKEGREIHERISALSNIIRNIATYNASLEVSVLPQILTQEYVPQTPIRTTECTYLINLPYLMKKNAFDDLIKGTQSYIEQHYNAKIKLTADSFDKITKTVLQDDRAITNIAAPLKQNLTKLLGLPKKAHETGSYFLKKCLDLLVFSPEEGVSFFVPEKSDLHKWMQSEGVLATGDSFTMLESGSSDRNMGIIYANEQGTKEESAAPNLFEQLMTRYTERCHKQQNAKIGRARGEGKCA